MNPFVYALMALMLLVAPAKEASAYARHDAPLEEARTVRDVGGVEVASRVMPRMPRASSPRAQQFNRSGGTAPVPRRTQMGVTPSGRIVPNTRTGEFNAKAGAPPRPVPTQVKTQSGQVFTVPKGASGPNPTRSNGDKGNPNGGIAYQNGTGKGAERMRIMPPTKARGKYPAYPNGYVKYERHDGGGWQAINKQTGGLAKDGMKGHIPISPERKK